MALRNADDAEVKRFREAMLIIGIDPGANTGIAMWSRGSKTILWAKTVDFWGAIEQVREYGTEMVAIVIEDPAQNKPTFAGHGDVGREKISQNVGSNKAEARLLIEGLRRMGFVVRAIRPAESKWTAAECRLITKYEGRTSEHSRDAIRICYGY